MRRPRALRRPSRGLPRRAADRGRRRRDRKPATAATGRPKAGAQRKPAPRSAQAPAADPLGATSRARCSATSSSASSSVRSSSADGDELAVARVLGQQRVAHLLPAGVRRLGGHLAGGGRIPVEAERLVHRLQHAAHARRVAHHHDDAHVRRARDQALADAGQLRSRRARSRCRCPGQYSPGHLPHARVHAERRQRALARARPSPRSAPGCAPGAAPPARACARPIVPSWNTAARPPASRSTGSKPPARAARTASE